MDKSHHISSTLLSKWWAHLLIGLLLCSSMGCSSLPIKPLDADYRSVDTSQTRIAQSYAPAIDQHPNLSGFLALDNGITALAARLALINRAEKTLDLQYYIWHDDQVGRVLHNRLLAAADRGVKVRLLLDDFDTAGKDNLLSLINHHPNIDIRLFNPFQHRNARWWALLTDSSRLNRRMHNKAIIADRSAAIMGGRNIGDEYFGVSQEVEFSDMDVLAVGPVSSEIEKSFERFWNSRWSYPIDLIVTGTDVSDIQYQTFREQSDRQFSEARQSDYAKAIEHHIQDAQLDIYHANYTWSKWQLFHDNPQKITQDNVSDKHHLAPHLLRLIDNTKSDLVIVSPYFVPGKKFTRYLVEKVRSGVRVRILTNSLASNDVGLVHAGYRRYREQLVEGGVELYEFKPIIQDNEKPVVKQRIGSSNSSLHGKYLGFDERSVFVGSFNLDGRSVSLNTELGVYFESQRYALKLSQQFDRLVLDWAYAIQLNEKDQLVWKTRENGQWVEHTKEPETSAWQRFSNRIMSLIVPESQL